MKFDPEHLRIAAEVRAKAQGRRRFELVGWLLFLLITSLVLAWALVMSVRLVLLLAFHDAPI